MSRICKITSKRTLFGNKVSFSKKKTRKLFFPNIKKKKFWISSENKFIKLKVSTKAIRMIDKHGIEKFLKKI